MAVLNIQGSDAMSTKMRKEALEKINQLDDTTLSRLSELAASKEAKSYLTNSFKWGILKGYINL